MRPSSRTVIPACPDCGYEGRMTSPAAAAHALRMHSCDKQRRDQDRARRVAARAASSGPEAPCNHDGRHAHGQRARYVLDLCRCRPCRDAAAAYERQRSRLVAYGTWVAYVDAGPVRELGLRPPEGDEGLQPADGSTGGDAGAVPWRRPHGEERAGGAPPDPPGRGTVGRPVEESGDAAIGDA